MRDLGFFKTAGQIISNPLQLTLKDARIGGSSFEKFQQLFLIQLGLFYYVHERGLVNLFVERYDCASTICVP